MTTRWAIFTSPSWRDENRCGNFSETIFEFSFFIILDLKGVRFLESADEVQNFQRFRASRVIGFDMRIGNDAISTNEERRRHGQFLAAFGAVEGFQRMTKVRVEVEQFCRQFK